MEPQSESIGETRLVDDMTRASHTGPTGIVCDGESVCRTPPGFILRDVLCRHPLGHRCITHPQKQTHALFTPSPLSDSPEALAPLTAIESNYFGHKNIFCVCFDPTLRPNSGRFSRALKNTFDIVGDGPTVSYVLTFSCLFRASVD